MAKRKPPEPPPGAPAWQATFADLMNLLLCFFVMLFSMSSVDAQKFELLAASFNQTFSIFKAGATAIGEGVLPGMGVSQLNELDNYINSTGRDNEGDTIPENLESATQIMEEAKLKESEELAEKIEETLNEKNLDKEIDIEFTAQYVQLTLNGALLFDSGSVVIKEEAMPLMNQLGIILERFAEGNIEIEGHTDNVPMSGAKYSNNDELSSGRALSVFYYLEQNTLLDVGKIKHSGRGEYEPIADNSTEEGRAQNRRVEIKVYNSLSAY